MEGGQAATLTELAAQLGGERTFIYHSLELVNLAPDIQKANHRGADSRWLHAGETPQGDSRRLGGAAREIWIRVAALRKAYAVGPQGRRLFFLPWKKCV